VNFSSTKIQIFTLLLHFKYKFYINFYSKNNNILLILTSL